MLDGRPNRSKVRPMPSDEQFRIQKETKTLVLQQVDYDVVDTMEDGRWRIRFYLYSCCCVMSLLFGMLLFLYGYGLTVLFQNNKFNKTYVILSAFFIIPVALCLRLFCLPSNKEKIQRHYASLFRKKAKDVKLKQKMVQLGREHEVVVEDEYLHNEDLRPSREEFLTYDRNKVNGTYFEDFEQMVSYKIKELIILNFYFILGSS